MEYRNSKILWRSTGEKLRTNWNDGVEMGGTVNKEYGWILEYDKLIPKV